jgi:photosystem II stability/assembly factor-like uncharacterized protein
LQAIVQDPQHLYLGTTFGLVFTADAGGSWRYVCEPYVTGGSNVQLYALQPDGALLAVSTQLTRSTDQGCTWSTIAPPAGASWVDVFADPGNAARVLGVAWVSGGSGVWLSLDGGQTFPTQLLSTTERVLSVESAATDPDTIYAATQGTAFFASTDAGAHWQRSDVPGAPPLTVRILAVSSTDSKTLWLRATNPADNADAVLASTDGGATFVTRGPLLPRADRICPHARRHALRDRLGGRPVGGVARRGGFPASSGAPPALPDALRLADARLRRRPAGSLQSRHQRRSGPELEFAADVFAD